jgi:hypothetical protein
MRTDPDDIKETIRTLRRRNPLLDAWLEALDRIEAPHDRGVMARNPGSQRRPLMPSVERHPMGRRRPPCLVVVPRWPIRP